MSTKPALLLLCTTSLRDGLPPTTRTTFFCGVASPRVQVSLTTGLQSGGGPIADCTETPGDLRDSSLLHHSGLSVQTSKPSLGTCRKMPLYPQKTTSFYTGMPQHTQAYPHLPSAWTVGAWRGPGTPAGGSELPLAWSQATVSSVQS